MNESFLYRLVKVVADNMSNFYPYLLDKVDDISKLIMQEEEKFLLTLESGEKRLVDYISNATDKIISKETAFLLYDTFGFPLELTLEVAEEYGFSVDIDGFNEELEKQKIRARNSRNDEHSMNFQNEEMIKCKEKSDFVGYDVLETTAEVVAIFKDQKLVKEASGRVLAIFKRTPLYAESGGQVGDIGVLIKDDKKYKITSTTKLPNFQHSSMIELDSQTLKQGEVVTLMVDKEFRRKVIKNHSAAHLLNESLRRILGKHVYQQGSYVDDTGLRFDFNNYNPLTNEEVLEIENLVNKEINEAIAVKISEMPIDQAKNMDVQAVFGEKYGDIVRVVDMDFSKELCGGCHVSNTKDIDKFVILGVESKGSGIYRIEATTSENIKRQLEKVLENIISEINDLNNKADSILEEAKKENIDLEYQQTTLSDFVESYELIIKRRDELNNLREQVKELDKKFNKMKKEKNIIPLDEYLKNVLTINGNSVLIFKTFDLEIDIVKDLLDRLSDTLSSSVVFAANILDDKVIFVCKNKIKSLHAGNLVKQAALLTNGNGGGRNDFAQAGGKDPTKVEEALTEVKNQIENKL